MKSFSSYDTRLQRNFCGCGFAANGDEQPAPVETVKSEAMNMQAWQYAKTGLAIVGAFVVIRFIYNKFVKK